jgi:hypothetical protein
MEQLPKVREENYSQKNHLIPLRSLRLCGEPISFDYSLSPTRYVALLPSDEIRGL